MICRERREQVEESVDRWTTWPVYTVKTFWVIFNLLFPLLLSVQTTMNVPLTQTYVVLMGSARTLRGASAVTASEDSHWTPMDKPVKV